MLDNLKMQLKCKFELELLCNHALKIVNFDHNHDTNYAGAEIVELMEPYYDDSYYSVVNGIAFDSAYNLLKQGVIENLYLVYYDESGQSFPGDEYYTKYFCTDFKTAAGILTKLYAENELDDDPCSLNRNMIFIHLIYLEDNEIKYKRIH